MNINELLKQDTDVEAVRDFVGGGYIKDSDIYQVKIMHAFFEESKGGAMGVNISLKHNDEKKSVSTFTLYVTSGTAKGKKPYYVNKKGGKVPLPGYTVVDDMVRLATSNAKGLDSVTTTPKSVEVYDFAAGGKINKSVNVIDQLTDAIVEVGIIKTLNNKFKDGAPTVDTVSKNEIDRVFGIDGRTIREVSANKPAAAKVSWLENNKGQVQNKVTLRSESPTSSIAAVSTTDDTDDLFATT